MLQLIFKSLKSLAFIFLFISVSIVSFSQIDLGADTIPEAVVELRKAEFDRGLNTARVRPIKGVVFKIDQLMDLLSKCRDAGETDVQFMFGKMRTVDADAYVKRHGGTDEATVVNKPTLFIRVPRYVFKELAEVKSLPQGGSATGMLLFSLNGKDYYEAKDSYLVKKHVYLDIGAICPPPNSCN